MKKRTVHGSISKLDIDYFEKSLARIIETLAMVKAEMPESMVMRSRTMGNRALLELEGFANQLMRAMHISRVRSVSLPDEYLEASGKTRRNKGTPKKKAKKS